MERREILKRSSPNISGSKGMSKPKRRITSEFPLRRSPRLLGTNNSDSLSRSSHLLAKPAMPPLGQISCPKPTPAQGCQTLSRKPREHIGKGSSSGSARYPDYGFMMRTIRAGAAIQFMFGYKYCASMEKITLICSGDTCSELVKSHGIAWVAVHGMESICVVYRNEAVDESRVGDINKRYVMQYFGKYIISQMEVSVIQGTDNVQEVSSHEALDVVLNGSEAVKFLQREIYRDSAFSPSETKKTALSAFQLLFHQKLKASDIQVMELRGSTITRYDPSFKYTHFNVFHQEMIADMG